MSQTIRAHFDGKFIIPDEPVNLPVNQPLEVSINPASLVPHRNGTASTPTEIADRLRKLREFAGSVSAPVLSDEALRRESIYNDRE